MARRNKPVPTETPAPDAEPVVVARYIGDGTVFQSGIPHERDITDLDNLSDELIELAVATGTHEKVS